MQLEHQLFDGDNVLASDDEEETTGPRRKKDLGKDDLLGKSLSEF